MKRLSTSMLAIALATSLVACGDDDDDKENPLDSQAYDIFSIDQHQSMKIDSTALSGTWILSSTFRGSAKDDSDFDFDSIADVEISLLAKTKSTVFIEEISNLPAENPLFDAASNGILMQGCSTGDEDGLYSTKDTDLVLSADNTLTYTHEDLGEITLTFTNNNEVEGSKTIADDGEGNSGTLIITGIKVSEKTGYFITENLNELYEWPESNVNLTELSDTTLNNGAAQERNNAPINCYNIAGVSLFAKASIKGLASESSSANSLIINLKTVRSPGQEEDVLDFFFESDWVDSEPADQEVLIEFANYTLDFKGTNIIDNPSIEKTPMTGTMSLTNETQVATGDFSISL